MKNNPAFEGKLPNIIFLDFDGCLVTNRACLAMGNTGGCFSYFDPIACHLVKRLCEQCDAKIVISSAWRIIHDRTSIAAILGAVCPNLDRYIWNKDEMWCTPRYIPPANEFDKTSDRGREIKHWIDCHPEDFNNFVIIDDMANMRPLQDNLVKCELYDGLGWHQYYAAEKILMAGYSINQ